MSTYEVAASKMLDRIVAGDVGEVMQIACHELPPDLPMMTWSMANRLRAILQVLAEGGMGEIGVWNMMTAASWRRQGRGIMSAENRERVHAETGFATAPVFLLKPVTKKVVVEDEDGAEAAIVVVVGFESQHGGNCEWPATATYSFDKGNPNQGLVLNPPQREFHLSHIATAWGITVTTSFLEEVAAYGRTNGKDYIRLATDDEHVFFHELVHVAHARHLEALGKGIRDVDVDYREWVAEIGATVLANHFGLDYSGTARKYLMTHFSKWVAQGEKGWADRVAKITADIGASLSMIMEAQ